jgi:hypothetical protein
MILERVLPSRLARAGGVAEAAGFDFSSIRDGHSHTSQVKASLGKGVDDFFRTDFWFFHGKRELSSPPASLGQVAASCCNKLELQRNDNAGDCNCSASER